MAAQRVTSADVAALAGVSRSTVSYVLNGSSRHNFSVETVERVLAAAAELAYTPNAAARALRKGESGVVLLALPEMPLGWNFGRLLSGLTDTVTQGGHSLVAWYVRPGLRLRDILRDIAPRAILEIVPLPEQDREAAAAASVPIISTSTPLGGMDRAVGALQVRHLAGSGHRRLGIVTVADQSVAVFGDPRRQGVRETAAAIGLLPPRELVLDTRETAAAMGIKLPLEAGHGGHSGAAVRQLAETLHDWTAGPDPVTAICCFNDLFAALVIAAARSVGLTVPDHLSVIGVDDEPMGGFLQPTLTTVRFDFEGTTAYTQALLRATLDGKPTPPPPGGEFVELVERESVAPLTR
jgi:DNA-binding LacI/PurR family transcriptional regulator